MSRGIENERYDRKENHPCMNPFFFVTWSVYILLGLVAIKQYAFFVYDVLNPFCRFFSASYASIQLERRYSMKLAGDEFIQL